MMKRALYLLWLALLGFCAKAGAQNNAYQIDDEAFKYMEKFKKIRQDSSSIAYIDSMMMVSKRKGDVKAQCVAYNLYVEYALKVSNNLPDIRAAHNRCVEFAKNTPYTQYIFGSWNQLLSFMVNHHLLLEMIDEIKQYREMAFELKSVYGIGRSYVRESELFFILKQYDECIKNCNQAIEYYQKSGDTRELSPMYSNISHCYMQMEKYQEAVEYAQYAIDKAVSDWQAIQYRLDLALSLFRIKDRAAFNATLDSMSTQTKKMDLAQLEFYNFLNLLRKHWDDPNAPDSIYSPRRYLYTRTSEELYRLALMNGRDRIAYHLQRKIKENNDSVSRYMMNLQLEDYDMTMENLRMENELASLTLENMKMQLVKSQQLEAQLALQSKNDSLQILSGKARLGLTQNRQRLQQEENERLKVMQAEKEQAASIALRQRTTIVIFLLCLILILVFVLVLTMRTWRRLRSERQQAVDLQRKAQLADAQKTRFLEMMNHEIRTPLNSIVGFTDILGSCKEYGLDDAEKMKLQADIHKQSNLLQRLVNEILDMSKLESGTYQFQNDIVDPAAFCEEVIAKLRPSLAPSVQLKTQFSDTCQFYADQKRLSQLLYHLLRNAIDNTSQGHIILSMAMQPAGRANYKVLNITVEDTGVGIPSEKRELLFERFSKLNPFSVGFGLGLSFCDVLMQKLGGKIWLDESYSPGARFCCKVEVEIPR